MRTLDQEGFLSHLRIIVLFQSDILPALLYIDETWALCFATWNSESQERNIILLLNFSVSHVRSGSHVFVPLLMSVFLVY